MNNGEMGPVQHTHKTLRVKYMAYGETVLTEGYEGYIRLVVKLVPVPVYVNAQLMQNGDNTKMSTSESTFVK